MGHEEDSSNDWLPAGWKVNVSVRKTGKKDKCYVDPSSKHKFFSKPEVLRYLKDVEVSQPVREETQNKSTSSCSAIKFVEKEEAAQGLPAGWIKETRVTQKGIKIRRDLFYIDPISGRQFRSRKEVSRYLVTGKMGRRASKAKEQSPIKLELIDYSLSTSVETEENRTADSKVEKQVVGNQIPKPDTAAGDNDILLEADKFGEGETKESLPEANKLKEIEKKESSSECTSTVTEVLVQNSHTGTDLHATNHKKRKLSNKKVADIPRRTSQRLAGVKVSLSLEAKSPTPVRRTAGRKASEKEVNCSDEGDNLADLLEQAKKVRIGTAATGIKQESVDALPPGDVCLPEVLGKLGIPDCKGDEKAEAPLGVSVEELCKDPCIEFAIKTLMGEVHIGDETKVAMNQGSSSNLTDAVPGSRVDSPSKDLWSDPCFEFAVKTLTGEIDASIENVQRQQPPHNPSSESIESFITSTNFKSAGFSHASVSSKNSSVAEVSIHKQRL